MTPAAAVREHLVAEGVAGGSSGWAAFEGGLTDLSGERQVAVFDTAGRTPIAAHASAGILRAGVQVLVRGFAGEYELTREKAVSVWDALHRQRIDGAQSVEGVNNPVWLGYTSDRRPTWSLNFILWTEKG